VSGSPANPPERPEQAQARIRQAEREHDEYRKLLGAMFTSIITFASEALKAAALVNGGAAAASLALVSQVIDKRPALARISHAGEVHRGSE